MQRRNNLDLQSQPVKITLLIMLAFSLAFLSGCSSLKKFTSRDTLFSSSSPMGLETPESLAMDGLEKFNHGNYHAALKIFEDLKSRFPFSPHGMLAELKAADCQYYLDNFDEALVLYEEFWERHPTNEAIPYVIFQIGLSHYKQIDTIDRDSSGAENSVQAFSRLLRAFPGSPYTTEAEARIKAAKNFLANHEYYVTTFYVRTKSYDQAEVRLNYLLKNYPDTDVAPQARNLLAAIKNGNPPKTSWFDWVPDLELPDWRIFSAFKKKDSKK